MLAWIILFSSSEAATLCIYLFIFILLESQRRLRKNKICGVHEKEFALFSNANMPSQKMLTEFFPAEHRVRKMFQSYRLLKYNIFLQKQ